MRKISNGWSAPPPRGGEKVLSGGIDFAANNIKAVALPTSYTYSQSHEFLATLARWWGRQSPSPARQWQTACSMPTM